TKIGSEDTKNQDQNRHPHSNTPDNFPAQNRIRRHEDPGPESPLKQQYSIWLPAQIGSEDTKIQDQNRHLHSNTPDSYQHK
ncbi:hypothetical protein J6590_102696, partial [Homalodisca vitripennis]